VTVFAVQAASSEATPANSRLSAAATAGPVRACAGAAFGNAGGNNAILGVKQRRAERMLTKACGRDPSSRSQRSSF